MSEKLMDGSFCEHCKLTIFNYHFVVIRSEMQVQAGLLVVLFVDVLIKVTEKEEEMKNKEETNKSKTYKNITDLEQGTR